MYGTTSLFRSDMRRFSSVADCDPVPSFNSRKDVPADGSASLGVLCALIVSLQEKYATTFPDALDKKFPARSTDAPYFRRTQKRSSSTVPPHIGMSTCSISSLYKLETHDQLSLMFDL